MLWIAFTGVSSSRSRLGVAAGIWSRGVILTSSLRIEGLIARPGQHDRRLCSASVNVALYGGGECSFYFTLLDNQTKETNMQHNLQPDARHRGISS